MSATYKAFVSNKHAGVNDRKSYHCEGLPDLHYWGDWFFVNQFGEEIIVADKEQGFNQAVSCMKDLFPNG